MRINGIEFKVNENVENVLGEFDKCVSKIDVPYNSSDIDRVLRFRIYGEKKDEIDNM